MTQKKFPTPTRPLARPFLLLLLLTLVVGTAPAQKPLLLRDINKTNPQNKSSQPGPGTRMGLFTFFSARTQLANGQSAGVELFRTLGEPTTTALVKDIWPGAGESKPTQLTAVGNTLFFQASSNSRTGLWKSDGSTNGTVLVRNGVQLESPVAFRGKLYFLNRGVLWCSDGTANGTVVIKDFKLPLLLQGRVRELVVMGNSLYLGGWDPQTGLELWKSDGTAKGTVVVKDVVQGNGGIAPTGLTPLGNVLYFAASDSISGYELWRSDGTAQGTAMVKDVRPGSAGAFFSRVNGRFLPVVLTAAGSYLYFMADDGVNGAELWRTDGTAKGTILLRDIWPGAQSSLPETMVAFAGNRVLVTANDGKIGYELWVSDGTPKGTVLVRDIFPGLSQFQLPNHGFPRHYLAAGNVVYFAASDKNGEEVWRSDGTPGGTFLLQDIHPGPQGSAPKNFSLSLSGKVLFSAFDGIAGEELWVSDGTPRGTALLEDILKPPGGATDSSDAQHYTPGHGVTWFVADDGNSKGLWRTDATKEGTRLVARVNVGGRSRPKLAAVGSQVFFNADDQANGTELWASDGTLKGTRLVVDIATGSLGSFPEELAAIAGVCYFAADDNKNGRELWRSDGTANGTFLVKDIFPGKDRPGPAGLPNHSKPKYLTGLGNTLIFQATDGPAGAELWRSDGTAKGTFLLKDIRPGSGGSSPKGLTVFGKEVWFIATRQNQPALFKTDGTAKGTVKVQDLPATELAVAGTRLFVLTQKELWLASGFGATTVTRVKNLASGPMHNPLAHHLTAVGNDVYFIADPTQSVRRGALFRSDGTAQGTQPVVDVQLNLLFPLSVGLPGERTLVAAGSRRVYFPVGRTPTGDRELWVSDGTKAGTRMVHDLRPGNPGSRPNYLTHAHGKLLFTANDGVVGNEIWSVDIAGNAQSLGNGCAVQGVPPALSASDPVLGGKMTTRLVGGRASSASVLAIGLPIPGPAPAFGACDLPVDFKGPHLLVFLTNDATGSWQLIQTVPNDPALVNLYLVLEAAQGPAATPPFGLDLSNAVYLQPGR